MVNVMAKPVRRIARGAAVIALLLAAVPGSYGGPPDKDPKKKQKDRIGDAERAEVMELIKLVDAAQAGQVPLTESHAPWVQHVLKATEGMGYVPVTMTFDAAPDAFRSMAVYVRVVARRPDGTEVPEQSGLKQWLIAEAARGIPRPPPIREFMAVNPEEMPTGGPAAGSRRSSVNSAQGATMMLALMEREHQRSMKAAEEKESKEGGEDKKREADSFLHPFEDFDFLDQTAGADRMRHIARAVAVPTGEYDLYLAVRERPGAAKAAVSPRAAVYRQPLTVPNLSNGLGLSSVILADRLDSLAVPVKPEQQAAHPYALGWTEIYPAVDREFSDQEQMGIVFQVLNPLPDPRRKPDITVEYLFHRKTTSGESLLTSARQDFNRTTLPPEFDLIAGHQLFTAQPVPLRAFPPGDYRLELRVTDRRAARTVAADISFTVIASDQSLWVGKTVASLIAPSFGRDDVLRQDVLGPALDRLLVEGSGSRESALRAAIGSARMGQYASLLSAISVFDQTDPVAAFLRGLALIGLSGNFDAAAGQFRRALDATPAVEPAALYLGACMAANGRDAQAIEIWQSAASASRWSPALDLLSAEAFLRSSNTGRALEVLNDASSRWPDDDRLKKRLAAARLATHDDVAALDMLESYLARHGDDLDALFLAIHALHRSATARSTGTDGAADPRLSMYASVYVTAQGPYQAVVQQWTRAR